LIPLPLLLREDAGYAAEAPTNGRRRRFARIMIGEASKQMKFTWAGSAFLMALWTLSAPLAARPTKAAGPTAGNAPLTIYFAKDPAHVPAFTVRGLDGRAITPADWRGKVVLLNFWATWCGPCRFEIPELVELQKKYQGTLEVVGLSVDDAPANQVKRFAEHLGVNYPIAIADLALQEKFGGVAALPTSFLIDRQGGVVQKHVGLFPPQLYETEIRALLGLPVDAKIETFADHGQVWLANASKATELPGIDLSKLTPEQRRRALRELNTTHCTCGCDLTLAQCRIVDTSCPVSLKMAQEILQKISGHAPRVASQKR
jgi:thiol-disulfide isomerase/thioredoxin